MDKTLLLLSEADKHKTEFKKLKKYFGGNQTAFFSCYFREKGL